MQGSPTKRMKTYGACEYASLVLGGTISSPRRILKLCMRKNILPHSLCEASRVDAGIPAAVRLVLQLLFFLPFIFVIVISGRRWARSATKSRKEATPQLAVALLLSIATSQTVFQLLSVVFIQDIQPCIIVALKSAETLARLIDSLYNFMCSPSLDLEP